MARGVIGNARAPCTAGIRACPCPAPCATTAPTARNSRTDAHHPMLSKSKAICKTYRSYICTIKLLTKYKQHSQYTFSFSDNANGGVLLHPVLSPPDARLSAQPPHRVHSWHSRQGLSLQPPVLETGALPIELREYIMPRAGIEPATTRL